MPAPICGSCGYSLTKVKSGVIVAEMRAGDKVPYKLWCADRYHCHTPDCDFTGFIISDFGFSPFAEQHDSDFKRTLEMHPPEVIWRERNES